MPLSVNVQPGGSQTFQATVSGTGNYSSAVTWSVKTAGGSTSDVGTITSAGIYTAPPNAPNPNTVSVTATSAADNTKSGTGSIVIGTSAWDITGIQVTPPVATVNTRWSVQLSASVLGTGTFNQAVAWSVNGIPSGNSSIGTVDGTGLYEAPTTVPAGGSVTVTATSVAATNISSSAKLTIVADPTPSPVISQISPSTANAGELVQITGTGFNGGGVVPGNVWVNFTGVNGIKIPVLLFYDAQTDTKLSVIVPLGAADGPVSVTAQGNNGGPPYASSNSVQFTRAPRIRIRAPKRDLSSGETEKINWVKIAGNSAVNLTWKASAGSITSDGVLTAPSGVTSEAYINVSACVQGTIYCDSEMIGIHPFRLTPEAPIAESGQSVQMQAVQGSSIVNATWTLDGPGSLSGTGAYTASSQFADGGGIPFLATSNGTSVNGTVEVTGQFPGLINRIADYFDANLIGGNSYAATFASNVGVVSNRLYVDATYYKYIFPVPDLSTSLVTTAQAVDVYDISDQKHPVWVDAFEPLVDGPFSYCGGSLYQSAQVDSSGTTRYRGGSIAIYNVSNGSPVPLQKVLIPPTVFSVYGQTGCTIAALTGQNGSNGTLVNRAPGQASIYQLQNGNVAVSDYSFPVPDSPDGQGTWNVLSVGSDGKRLYMELGDSTGANHLTTYDLTTASPTLLNMLPSDTTMAFLQLAPVDSLLFGTNGTFSRIYDVSGNTPLQVGQLLGGYVRAWNDTTVVTDSLNSGVYTIDISDPHAPALKASLYDFRENLASSDAVAGNYAYKAEGWGGLGVWDISESGGLAGAQISTLLDTVLPVSFAGNDSTGYLLTEGGNQGLLFRYDLSQNPPVQAGRWRQDNSTPQALALSGTTLYEGTTTALEVLDASTSGEPTIGTSIPLPVASLAVTGTSLLVGTGDNRLVVYSIAQPQNPVQVASVKLPGLPFQITASGSLALIADTTGGFLIYSVATPSSPVLLAKVSLPEVYGVAVDGNLALLAAREYGLVIVDLSNPANPRVLAHAAIGEDEYITDMYNKAISIAVLNKIAYVGVFNDDQAAVPDNGSSEIFGFDYSNPAEPRLVSLVGNDWSQDFSPVLWTSSKTLICGCTNFVYSFDLTQPRSVIGLFPFPEALQPLQHVGSIPPALRSMGQLSPADQMGSKSGSKVSYPAWPKGRRGTPGFRAN